MKIKYVQPPDGDPWLECYGPDAVTLERMLLRIDQRPNEHCRQAFMTFGKVNKTSRQILDIAAAWTLRDGNVTTQGVWDCMCRSANQPSGASDAANELLLMAIEWLVRNRGRYLEIQQAQ